MTELERETIKTEISPLMDKMISSLNNKEWDRSHEDYVNSPDFVAISTGHVFDYQTYIDGCKAANESLQTLVVTEVSRQYSFIDRNAVILTWKGSMMMESLDDQKFVADPYAISLLFVKTGDDWVISYSHESGNILPVVADDKAVE